MKIHLPLILLLSIFSFFSCKENTPSPLEASKPSASHTKATDSQSCKDCHQKEYQDWQGSHHHLAMSTKNYLADFANSQFTKKDETAHFFIKDKKEFIRIENTKGQKESFPVIAAIGITPLQQFVVTMPDGKWQCFPIAWDTEKKQWFDLAPDRPLLQLDDWLHWKNNSQNWNSMCAECHTTEYRKNYDSKTDEYKSTWDEFDVGCIACHHKGKEHISFQNTKQGTDPIKSLALDKQSSFQEIESCAPCHSRRSKLTEAQNLDGKFHDSYMPELTLPNIYHADGQILDEVFVYGSFTQSKMYHMGIRCSNCHNPHSLKLKAPEGQPDQVCMQCHDPKNYAQPRHTLHPIGNKGASCIECHMPGKHYMGVDFRRDHSFRVPRPDLSVKYGTPNACQKCHADKGDQWAADQLSERLKLQKPSIQEHHGQYLAAVINGDLGGAEMKNLAKLREIALGKSYYRGHTRATVFEAASWHNALSLEEIVAQFKDSDPIVRIAAITPFNSAPQEARFTHLTPLLKDPVRGVRIRAFQTLAAPSIDAIAADFKTAYTQVEAELEEYYRENAERPDISFGRALLAERRGQADEAIHFYREVLKRDTLHTQALSNLGLSLAKQKKYEKGLIFTQKAVDLYPEVHSLSINLALIYDAKGDAAQAAKILNEKIQKARMTPNFYELGAEFALKSQNNALAQKILEQAILAHPQNIKFFEDLFAIYLEKKNFPKAQSILDKMQSLAPNSPKIKYFQEVLNRSQEKK